MKILVGIGSLLFGAAAAGGAETADTFLQAFVRGQPSLTLRLRSEEVRQAGLVDATAITVGTRLGFTTAPLAGWQAMVEAENVSALDPDAYSQAGLNPGGTGRAVVADPTGTEFDQAWLAFRGDGMSATLGRQRIVLDNARFIGDSSWRQHLQTFDALVLRDTLFAGVTLAYAYLNRINRVYGSRHPQGYWPSDSHLLHASYAGGSVGTFTGYAYLLDFRGGGAANSCATYGASFAGERQLTGGWKINYRAEVATQSDYGHSPLRYSARYQLVETGLAAAAGGLTLGCEVLGSGRGVGFKTPLATLHAFDGWADLFLATPAGGLRDAYVKGSVSLPARLTLLASYHWFAADRAGADPGREFDVQLGRKFTPHLSGLLKLADFRHEAAAYPDVRKLWAQVEFTY